MAPKFPRISPTKIDRNSKIINPTPIDKEERISFNFRRLNPKDTKFDWTCCEVNYFNTLIDRLRNLSNCTRKEMLHTFNQKSLRFHPLNFKDGSLSEKTFGVLSEDVDDDAWQFELTANKHGRVHGYFVENVFYVVWLDPKHELYP